MSWKKPFTAKLAEVRPQSTLRIASLEKRPVGQTRIFSATGSLAEGYNYMNGSSRFKPRSRRSNFSLAPKGVTVCPHAQIDNVRQIRCTLAHGMVWLRQGLRRLLEDEPDMTVVAEAGSAVEALQNAGEHRPEVVIADWHLFEDSAETAQRMIQAESPASRVVFLGTTEKHAPQGVDLSYCAVRDTSAGDLVRMVRAAAGRDSEPVQREGGVQVREFIPRNRILTAREREVLKLLAEGRTVRSVAGVLGLSIKTVDAHKFNLMRKLGIHNKAELVMWAIQKKMVKVPVNF